jgi:hypothetical protein
VERRDLSNPDRRLPVAVVPSRNESITVAVFRLVPGRPICDYGAWFRQDDPSINAREFPHRKSTIIEMRKPRELDEAGDIRRGATTDRATGRTVLSSAGDRRLVVIDHADTQCGRPTI